MSTKEPQTFEEVNAHVEQYFAQAKQKSLAPTDVKATICGIYPIARPILVLLSGLPVIPTKWKDAIKMLIAALDAFCPGH